MENVHGFNLELLILIDELTNISMKKNFMDAIFLNCQSQLLESCVHQIKRLFKKSLFCDLQQFSRLGGFWATENFKDKISSDL